MPEENLFCTRECKATHWMIISKLFFRLTQQAMEWRVAQICNRDQKSLLLISLSNIHSQVALRDLCGSRRLMNAPQKVLWTHNPWQRDAHFCQRNSWSGGNLVGDGKWILRIGNGSSCDGIGVSLDCECIYNEKRKRVVSSSLKNQLPFVVKENQPQWIEFLRA